MTPVSFSTPGKLTEALCADFHRHMARLNLRKKQINLALSGGNTPGLFFDRLAAEQQNPDNRTDWSKVHLFWVDERCVAPMHPESNYGMTERKLLRFLDIDKSHIHRIRGEEEPGSEAVRYGAEIRHTFHQYSGIPVFDWIFLGIGEDGHTASIFPDRLDLLQAAEICEATRHPETGQFRVTLTGPVIRQADRISFIVTGEAKSTVIRQIMNREPEAARYPANFILPLKGKADWYIDADAAKQLNLKGPKY
jgi:6-phosphogluconolactonase